MGRGQFSDKCSPIGALHAHLDGGGDALPAGGGSRRLLVQTGDHGVDGHAWGFVVLFHFVCQAKGQMH